MTADEVFASFEERGVRRVKLGAFDLDGILRGKHVSLEKFRSALDSGLGFCDVIFGWDSGDVLYDNVKFTGWHTGYPDCVAQIDLDAFRTIPWEPGTAFFLLDLADARGEPVPVAPRQVLRRVVTEAEARGFGPHFSAEYEFFVFRETPQSLREKNYQNPEDWPLVIRTWIKESKDPAMAEVFKCKETAEFSGPETVKGWSMIDFLLTEHREKFLDYLSKLRGQKEEDDEKTLKEVFGWTLDDFDLRWRTYARASY